jgi:hypothetical protein
VAVEWRYEFSLAGDCLDRFTTWLERSVRDLVVAAAAFVAARVRA